MGLLTGGEAKAETGTEGCTVVTNRELVTQLTAATRYKSKSTIKYNKTGDFGIIQSLLKPNKQLYVKNRLVLFTEILLH